MRFYGPGSYRGCPWTWAKRIRYTVMRLVLGRWLHVSVQDDDGWLYNCEAGGPCRVGPAEASLQRPIRVVPIEVLGGVDQSVLYEFPVGRKPLLLAILHAMYLLPRRHPVMNCVQATCRLIGEEEIFRTPRELLFHLESGHERSLRWRLQGPRGARAN